MAPTDCVHDGRLSGPECSGACMQYCTGKPDMEQMLHLMRRWLAQRLQSKVASQQAVNIILYWLEVGGSVREMGERISRSEKLVYHYRWQIMQALGIRNTALEFIPSVTVNAGPAPAGCSSDCLMRVFAEN
ncbi:hypothetical protein [Citrobacter meridianamericanus]|uniref:Uncharacterized protein n=1 Tax=Citrobacter meridianamericanus TaxID=2894201 RepID=A0ABT1BI08_9ENTR|nr:hypothetical protein [Citrobacter meridianamericanus]MCO5784684.1 hypothetical protein [Citrobacter meridianamericanus]